MSTEADFVMKAQPHSWLLVADNLHTQAQELYTQRNRTYITQSDGSGNQIGKWDGVNRSIFLLGGFALENAIKAVLIYENPSWISNGRLSQQLNSHSLTTLSAKSSLIPYPNRGKWILKSFEDGLESWARYPCGLSVQDIADEGIMTPKLWHGYLRLMQAYQRKSHKMLRRLWRGPHGFEGRYEFSGEFFENIT